MYIQKILPLLTLLASPAFAASDIALPDECPQAGTVIQHLYSRDQSETVNIDLDYKGPLTNASIEHEGSATLRIFKIFNDKVCQKTSYDRQVESCKILPADDVLPSSYIYKKIFDPYAPVKERAELIYKNFKFEEGLLEDAIRKQYATELAEGFAFEITKTGTVIAPRTWAEFQNIMSNLFKEGYATEQTSLDIVNTYGRHHFELLDMDKNFPNAVISEGSGNDILKDIFNPFVKKFKRAVLIQESFVGIEVGDDKALELANHFVKYDDTPKSWNEFKAVLATLAENDLISDDWYFLVTTKNEQDNREAFGFTKVAEVCRIDTVESYYNKVIETTSRETKSTEEVSYQVVTNNLLLRSSENGTTTIQLGLDEKSTDIYSSNLFHSSLITSFQNEESEVRIVIDSERKLLNVQNSLQVNVQRDGKNISMTVTDSAFSLDIGGQSYIEATVYEVKFGRDRKIGTQTYPLSSENSVTQLDTEFKLLKAKRKARVVYKLIRSASPFFSSQPSAELKSEKN